MAFKLTDGQLLGLVAARSEFAQVNLEGQRVVLNLDPAVTVELMGTADPGAFVQFTQKPGSSEVTNLADGVWLRLSGPVEVSLNRGGPPQTGVVFYRSI